MALTRDFKDTIQARANRDPKFRVALASEITEETIADGGDKIAAMLSELLATICK
jgi:hypothetical protein